MSIFEGPMLPEPPTGHQVPWKAGAVERLRDGPDDSRWRYPLEDRDGLESGLEVRMSGSLLSTSESGLDPQITAAREDICASLVEQVLWWAQPPRAFELTTTSISFVDAKGNPCRLV